MTTRLAIFDFDGTLADTYPVFIGSINALAVRHRFRQVEHHETEALRRLSAIDVLRELRLPLWRVPAVAADFRAMMRERIHEVQPFPGVVEALRAMAERRIEVAVATSNSLDNVSAVVGASLVGNLAALECGSPLFGKQHRLRRILQKTRIPCSDAIYVGDEIRDADAARRVGMAFGAVAWGYTELDALLRQHPAQVFRSPDELLRLSGA
jgi:phosphoglycolate phosphatase